MESPENTKNLVDARTKIDQKVEEVKEKLEECDSVIKKEFIILRAISFENKGHVAKITDNIFAKIVDRLKEKLELYTLPEIEQYEKAALTRDCLAVAENLFFQVHEVYEVSKELLEKLNNKLDNAIIKYYKELKRV